VEVLEQATHPTRLVKQIKAVEEERRVRRNELRLHFKEDHE